MSLSIYILEIRLINAEDVRAVFGVVFPAQSRRRRVDSLVHLEAEVAAFRSLEVHLGVEKA